MRAPSWWRRRTPAPPVVEPRPLGIGDLNHPDRATRQAAEAAWLREAREHQAAQAQALRTAVTDG